jgi:hypothetical protein
MMLVTIYWRRYTQHNDIQHTGFQHNGIQHKVLICDTQH